MKWIYYIVVFFLLHLVFLSVFSVHQAVAKELSITPPNYHKHQIRISQVHSEQSKLNEIIKNKMAEYKNNFLKQCENNLEQKEEEYTLEITSENYHYQNYLSYVFWIKEYLGDKTNYSIWTIVYDIEREKEINFKDFMNEDPSFFLDIQNKIRKNLLYNPKVTNIFWMISGTELNMENFNRFILTEQGFHFYFHPSQVTFSQNGIIKTNAISIE